MFKMWDRFPDSNLKLGFFIKEKGIPFFFLVEIDINSIYINIKFL